MFKNRNGDGTKNICGEAVKRLRAERELSQRQLADQLQLVGLDIGKNAVQQIECRNRFVPDIELVKFAEFFRVSVDDLLGIINK